jgi:hypothetical protein
LSWGPAKCSDVPGAGKQPGLNQRELLPVERDIVRRCADGRRAQFELHIAVTHRTLRDQSGMPPGMLRAGAPRDH